MQNILKFLDGQDKAIGSTFHKLEKSGPFLRTEHSKDAYFCKPFVGWILAMTVCTSCIMHAVVWTKRNAKLIMEYCSISINLAKLELWYLLPAGVWGKYAHTLEL